MRWKIENEGFNVQKKGGYELEHAYTNNPNSAKIFYFLLQIAHLLAQLLHKAHLLKRDFPNGFGSAKNLAFRLLEAWRNARMTQADIIAVFQKDFKSALILLDPFGCSSPVLPDNFNSLYGPNRWITGHLFSSRVLPIPTPSYPNTPPHHYPLILYCWLLAMWKHIKRCR